jgi:hypothetical protein
MLLEWRQTMLRVLTLNLPDQAVHFHHFQCILMHCWDSLALMKMQLSVEDMMAVPKLGIIYNETCMNTFSFNKHSFKILFYPFPTPKSYKFNFY